MKNLWKRKLIILTLITFVNFFGKAEAILAQTPKKIDAKSSEILNDKVKMMAKPIYPPAAIKSKQSGTVNVRVRIDNAGNVTEAEAISGNILLRESAVKAAKQTSFYPKTVNGKNVNMSGILVVKFVLPAEVSAKRNDDYFDLSTLDLDKQIADSKKSSIFNSDFVKGEIALQTGKYQDAIEAFTKYIKSYPEDNKGFIERARTFALTNVNDDKAINDYRKALKLLPDDKDTKRDLDAVLERFNYDSSVTTTSELKDVKTSDAHYKAIQSLVERFGVMFVFNDGKFHAEKPFTRGQFAAFLENGLGRLSELTNASGANLELGEGNCYLPSNSDKLFCLKYSANKSKIISMSQIKDVKENEAYFRYLQSLTERYQITFCDSDDNFRSSKTVTKKEFYELLESVFGYAPIGAERESEPLTRSEFVVEFNKALEKAMEKL